MHVSNTYGSSQSIFSIDVEKQSSDSNQLTMDADWLWPNRRELFSVAQDVAKRAFDFIKVVYELGEAYTAALHPDLTREETSGSEIDWSSLPFTPIKCFPKGFKIEKLIAETRVSKVYQVKRLADDHLCVIKEVVLPRTASEFFLDYRLLKSEIETLQKLSENPHPGIVPLLSAEDRVSSNRMCHLIMEMGPEKELFEYVGKVSVEGLKFITAQLVLVLEHLKVNHILHRDIKLENILITDQGQIKLVDFGYAKILGPWQRATTNCGTDGYFSPEVFFQRSYGFPTDYWSFAVTLHVLAFGVFPFGDHWEGRPKLIESISRAFKANYPPYFPDKHPLLDQDFVDFLTRFLNKDPSRRADISQARHHPWMKDFEWNQVYEQKDCKWLEVSK